MLYKIFWVFLLLCVNCSFEFDFYRVGGYKLECRDISAVRKSIKTLNIQTHPLQRAHKIIHVILKVPTNLSYMPRGVKVSIHLNIIHQLRNHKNNHRSWKSSLAEEWRWNVCANVYSWQNIMNLLDLWSVFVSF